MTTKQVLKNYSDLLIICYEIMANRYKMFCTFVSVIKH